MAVFFGVIFRFLLQSFLAKKNRQKRISTLIGAKKN